MFFYLSKLLWLVIQPSNALVVVLGAGALARLLDWRRLAAWLLYPAILALILIGVLPVGQWLLLPIENRFARPMPVPARVDGIVVLGGAIDLVLSEQRGDPQVQYSGERIAAIVELGRRYPDARLVYSGGADWLGGTRVTDAAVVRTLLQRQGFDVGRVFFEDQARNTVENAVYAKAHAAPAPGELWLLVTSAHHMPRSMGVFRRAGWPVVAWPVDYLTGEFAFFGGVNVARQLVEFDLAVKQWVGLTVYWLTDRTDAWLPAP